MEKANGFSESGNVDLSESCAMGTDLSVYSVLFEQKEFKKPKPSPLSNCSPE